METPLYVFKCFNSRVFSKNSNFSTVSSSALCTTTKRNILSGKARNYTSTKQNVKINISSKTVLIFGFPFTNIYKYRKWCNVRQNNFFISKNLSHLFVWMRSEFNCNKLNTSICFWKYMYVKSNLDSAQLDVWTTPPLKGLVQRSKAERNLI